MPNFSDRIWTFPGGFGRKCFTLDEHNSPTLLRTNKKNPTNLKYADLKKIPIANRNN